VILLAPLSTECMTLLLSESGEITNWSLTAPPKLLASHDRLRSPQTSYSEIEADSMTSDWSSPGPLPRNASTDSAESHRSKMLMRAGSSTSAEIEKSRQPGADRACSTTSVQPAR